MKNHWPYFLIIFFIVFWALYSLLFKVNYWQSHDGDFHLQRGYAAILSLKNGQLPLRWSKILNYDCGLPVYNFFYPLIYYIFGIFNLINLDLVFSFKLIFVIFYLIGTYSFYYLIFSIFKNKTAGLISAVMFALNPYYLQLIYVRANPELLTYCLLPFIFLLILKSKYILLFIILIFYFLSHNTTVLITFPLIIIFIIYQFIINKKYDKFLILTLIFSLLSASFFLGPALFEKNYIKLGQSMAADYQQHFPTLKQLLFSPWGWGYSTSDTNDGMSFKFGYVQWLILILSLFLSIYKKQILLLLIPLIFFLFLTLSPSQFIWKYIPLLQQLQYPWRLLGLCVFLVSLLAPLIYILISVKYRPILLVLIIVGSIITNRHHIQAIPNLLLPDFLHIGTTTIADELLPVNATKNCFTNSQQLSYFPNAYHINLNGQSVKYQDCSGYVCLGNVPVSSGNLQWSYQSTPIEKTFNFISVFSIVFWFILAFFKRK